MKRVCRADIRDASLHEYLGYAGAFKRHAYTVAADNRNLSIERDGVGKWTVFDINSATGAPMCAPVKS